eukprot:TRINITY_DN11505_c0_g1_i1.p1 TRINITY_DN11505_c0_g1~~TRINITY_DN11505_c0_g1_i1.p1  ORF type:complete len:1077 (-),score=174.16 TRINITY_DN11505_c0_g1_i1:34-3264(-)
MEDCCAVCAEPLEWVAIGQCNHREVCSSCVARMRFVLKDNKCCICKQESPAVFVTKFLGDYTKPPGDFAQLASRVRGEHSNGGQWAGDLWYHEPIEAYFDDEEQFKKIKAMNSLSCSICDKDDANGDERGGAVSVKLKPSFQHVDFLKRHYLQAHNLSMCDLCLEGKKVFVSEQKLYTKEELRMHKSRGNAAPDGSAEDSGGFKGHPLCRFCQTRFYSDNELYLHMTQEHYTCHICQKAKPGSFDYYHRYSDLENHFRRDHFICENDECLAKKFVVFTNEQELKRHSVQSHGENLGRYERNRALQIPAAEIFNFSRHSDSNGAGSSGSSRRSGPMRGRQPGGPGVLVVPHPDNVQLHNTLRASQETAALETALRESAALADNTEAQRARANRLEANRRTPTSNEDGEEANAPPGVEAFPTLAGASAPAAPPLTTGTAYAAAERARSSGVAFDPEYFPPLSAASSGASSGSASAPNSAYNRRSPQKQAQQGGVTGGGKTMASLLQKGRRGGQGGGRDEARGSSFLSSDDPPLGGGGRGRGAGGGAWQVNSSQASNAQAFPPVTAASNGATGGGSRTTAGGSQWPGPGASSSRATSSSFASSSVASRVPTTSLSASTSAFPSLSAKPMPPVASVPSGASPFVIEMTAEEIRKANRELKDKILLALHHDADSYEAFKVLSSRFQRGDIDASAYYDEISRTGLSFVVPDLARTIPDPEKRDQLLIAHAEGVLRTRPGAGLVAVGKNANLANGVGGSSLNGHSKDKSGAGALGVATSSTSRSGGTSGAGGKGGNGDGAWTTLVQKGGKAAATTKKSGAKESRHETGSGGGAGSGRGGEMGTASDTSARAAEEWKVVGRESGTAKQISTTNGVLSVRSPEGLSGGFAPLLRSSSSTGDIQGSEGRGSNGMSSSTSFPSLPQPSREPPLSSSSASAKPRPPPGAAAGAVADGADDTWECSVCTLANDGRGKLCAACGSSRWTVGGSSSAAMAYATALEEAADTKKTKKKAPKAKFQRLRLGDASAAAFFGGASEEEPPATNPWGPPGERPIGAPKGAWRGAGGQRLVSVAQQDGSANSQAWGK